MKATAGLLGILFCSALIACAPASSPSGDGELAGGVIYGEDNRQDLSSVREPRYLSWAASTVALVKSSQLSRSGTGYKLSAGNFGSSYNLCSSEPFRDQSNGAFCSGSLVGPDLIMTAGHCVRTAADCANTSFLFGYAIETPGQATNTFRSDEVYRCRSIIARQENAAGADFAIVKIDRVVTGRQPLPVRRSGAIAVGESLVVIGHPSGLPTKVTAGGRVRSIASADYFVANVDTYGGNSGSAVFNDRTGLIEGILVRGDTDFEVRNGCTSSVRRAANGGRGEDITRVAKVLSYLSGSSNKGSESSVLAIR